MEKHHVNNEVWQLEMGYLGAYTEDRALMARVRRYKLKVGWTEMARYYKNERLIGVHYKLPIEQRRVAFRMFGVTELKD
jgi:hypothetical protein